MMSTTQRHRPPAPRRGLRGATIGTLLGMLLVPVLVIATPTSASAWSSVTANPANVALLAEAAAMEGGVIAAAGTATGTAATTATAGAAAGGMTAAGAATTAAGARTGLTLAQKGVRWTAIFASVAGVFGLTVGKDPEAPGGGPGGEVQGWTNGNVARVYDTYNGWKTFQDKTFEVAAQGQDATIRMVTSDPFYNGVAGDAASAGGTLRVECRSGAGVGSIGIGANNYTPAPQTLTFSCSSADPLGRLVMTWGVKPEVSVYSFAPPDEPYYQITNSIRCQTSDGTKQASLSVTSERFMKSAMPDELPVPDVQCASGSVMIGSRGVLTKLVSPAVPDEVLWDYTAPAWVPQLAKEAPDCFTDSGTCTLTLKRTMPDGSVRDCFASPGLCTDWMPKQKAGSTEYSCWFGPYRQPITRCYAYPNPGLAPAVPTVKADGAPITDPGTDTPPDAGDSPVPGSAGNPTDAEGARCFPTGWGMLNPVEWVYKPVKCALVWAFVPSASTTAQIDALGPNLFQRTPFPQMGSAVTWLQPPPSSSRCWDLHVGFPQSSHLPTDVAVLNSCDRSNPVVAWMLDHRGILSAVIWFSTLAPFAWWFWRQYAPGASGVA